MVKLVSLTYAQQGMNTFGNEYFCIVVFSYLVSLVTRGTSIFFAREAAQWLHWNQAFPLGMISTLLSGHLFPMTEIGKVTRLGVMRSGF